MNVHITVSGVLMVLGSIAGIWFLLRVAYLIWLIARWDK